MRFGRSAGRWPRALAFMGEAVSPVRAKRGGFGRDGDTKVVCSTVSVRPSLPLTTQAHYSAVNVVRVLVIRSLYI